MARQTGDEHRLDREVIELTVAILEREGIRIRSVRGVFAEGAPAFPHSFLSEGSHVQIAVRDADLISDVRIVHASVVHHDVRPVVDPEDAGERMRRYLLRRSHRGVRGRTASPSDSS